MHYKGNTKADQIGSLQVPYGARVDARLPADLQNHAKGYLGLSFPWGYRAQGIKVHHSGAV